MMDDEKENTGMKNNEEQRWHSLPTVWTQSDSAREKKDL